MNGLFRFLSNVAKPIVLSLFVFFVYQAYRFAVGAPGPQGFQAGMSVEQAQALGGLLYYGGLLMLGCELWAAGENLIIIKGSFMRGIAVLLGVLCVFIMPLHGLAKYVLGTWQSAIHAPIYEGSVLVGLAAFLWVKDSLDSY